MTVAYAAKPVQYELPPVPDQPPQPTLKFLPGDEIDARVPNWIVSTWLHDGRASEKQPPRDSFYDGEFAGHRWPERHPLGRSYASLSTIFGSVEESTMARIAQALAHCGEVNDVNAGLKLIGEVGHHFPEWPIGDGLHLVGVKVVPDLVKRVDELEHDAFLRRSAREEQDAVRLAKQTAREIQREVRR